MQKIIFYIIIILISALGGHIIARILQDYVSLWVILPIVIVWGYGFGYFAGKFYTEYIEKS